MACIWPWTKNLDTQDLAYIETQRKAHAKEAQTLRVTSFALAMIAIFLLGFSYALYGLGSLPPTVLFGMGMFPYLGGVFFSFVAIGLILSSLITLALSAIHSNQKARWTSLNH